MNKVLFTILIVFFHLISVNTVNADIVDELVEYSSSNIIIPKYAASDNNITDEFIDNFVQNGSLLKIETSKYDVFNEPIVDELVDRDFIDKYGKLKYVIVNDKIIDDFANENIDKKKLVNIRVKNKYDFTKKAIPVNIKISKKFTAKEGAKEGHLLHFYMTEDTELNGITYQKGTHVVGKLEMLSSSDKMGVPETIVIDNFYLYDKPNIVFYGNISKTGANRSIWVYPLYQAGNIVLFVAGFVFVPIHGGHAKISTEDVYTVYYETNK